MGRDYFPPGGWDCQWDGDNVVISSQPEEGSDGKEIKTYAIVFRNDGCFLGHGRIGQFGIGPGPEFAEVADVFPVPWHWLEGIAEDGRSYFLFRHGVSKVVVEVPQNTLEYLTIGGSKESHLIRLDLARSKKRRVQSLAVPSSLEALQSGRGTPMKKLPVPMRATASSPVLSRNTTPGNMPATTAQDASTGPRTLRGSLRSVRNLVPESVPGLSTLTIPTTELPHEVTARQTVSALVSKPWNWGQESSESKGKSKSPFKRPDCGSSPSVHSPFSPCRASRSTQVLQHGVRNKVVDAHSLCQFTVLFKPCPFHLTHVT